MTYLRGLFSLLLIKYNFLDGLQHIRLDDTKEDSISKKTKQNKEIIYSKDHSYSSLFQIKCVVIYKRRPRKWRREEQ